MRTIIVATIAALALAIASNAAASTEHHLSATVTTTARTISLPGRGQDVNFDSVRIDRAKLSSVEYANRRDVVIAYGSDCVLRFWQRGRKHYATVVAASGRHSIRLSYHYGRLAGSHAD